MVLLLLLVAGLNSCSPPNSSEAVNAAPPSALDLMIREQEKVTNEYVRVAKKVKKDGDVSLTIRYIELEQKTRDGSARLNQAAPRMTPQQAQRVASLSAKVAPYLQP